MVNLKRAMQTKTVNVPKVSRFEAWEEQVEQGDVEQQIMINNAGDYVVMEIISVRACTKVDLLGCMFVTGSFVEGGNEHTGELWAIPPETTIGYLSTKSLGSRIFSSAFQPKDVVLIQLIGSKDVGKQQPFKIFKLAKLPDGVDFTPLV